MIKLIFKGIAIFLGLFLLFSHPWFTLLVVGLSAVLTYLYDKSKEQEEVLTRNYFNHINYVRIKTRKLFHNSMTDIHYPPYNMAYMLADKDSLGRIVGGFLAFDGKSFDFNNSMVLKGYQKPNNEARRKADVPGFDLVKRKWVMVQGKNRPLYLRTHLVPHRFCLNDGEYGHVMFAGTARLKIGMRVNDNFIPTYEEHKQNAEEILKRASYNPLYYMKAKRTAYLSLDDFERSVSLFVHRSAKTRKHLYKYGVECFYDDNSMIPSHVLVSLVDVSVSKVLFRATLLNIV